MQLSEIGRVAYDCWFQIPEHFPFVKLGGFIVMPNHVHGIVIIDKVDDGRRSNDSIAGNAETQRNAETQHNAETQNIAETQRNVKTQNFASLRGAEILGVYGGPGGILEKWIQENIKINIV